MLDEFTHEPRVAYFTMEIALHPDIPTYAGGLGMLAGDTVRSAADLGLPFVAVSLVSRSGHFHQRINDEGRQVELPAMWDPAGYAQALDAKIAVQIEGRDVWISAWLYVQKGHMGGRQPVLLLDTQLPENRDEDRELTHHLYGGDNIYRFKQEVVLGIGGARMLGALGFEIRKYHMNEGHSALLGLELLRRFVHPHDDLRPGESPYDLPRVRMHCCFTTHTPIEAGHDRFDYDLARRILGNVVELDVNRSVMPGGADDGLIDLTTLKHLAGNHELNMTRLALNLSEYVNGVAKRHAEVSKSMFPGYQVHAVTNGVHPYTWTSGSFRALFDRYLPGWCHEPEQLVRAECCIPDDAIWEAHLYAKRRLIDAVRAANNVSLNEEVPIIGFARRMTGYKRPDLLFSDLERLRAVADRRPFQVVLAGKAHPHDEGGKRLIELLHKHARELAGVVSVTYLPDYDMPIAQIMVAGVDVWLNTPMPPFEASGTSGMKAAFNGVPSLSVLDGWWIEGHIEGVTGWAIGDATSGPDAAASALYDKLENSVLALFYAPDGARSGWVRVMKGAISKNASYFNSHRMMRRYTTEAYIH